MPSLRQCLGGVPSIFTSNMVLSAAAAAAAAGSSRAIFKYQGQMIEYVGLHLDAFLREAGCVTRVMDSEAR